MFLDSNCIPFITFVKDHVGANEWSTNYVHEWFYNIGVLIEMEATMCSSLTTYFKNRQQNNYYLPHCILVLKCFDIVHCTFIHAHLCHSRFNMITSNWSFFLRIDTLWIEINRMWWMYIVPEILKKFKLPVVKRKCMLLIWCKFLQHIMMWSRFSLVF